MWKSLDYRGHMGGKSETSAIWKLVLKHGLITWSRPPWRSTSMTTLSYSWWRQLMETFSALLALCAWNSPVTGEFPTQRPVTRSFDIFFVLHLNKQLSKQWRCRWFEMPARSLWRHSNDHWPSGWRRVIQAEVFYRNWNSMEIYVRSLRFRDAIWCYGTRRMFPLVRNWCLTTPKSLPEPMLNYCIFIPKHISMKLYLKFKIWHSKQFI